MIDSLFGIVFFLTSVIPLIIFGLIGYYVVFVIPGRIQKQYSDFAANHGLYFDQSAKAQNYRGILPGLTAFTISGTDTKSGKPMQLFRMTYVADSDGDQSVYTRTAIELQINPTNNHIFINSIVNDATEQINVNKKLRYKAEGQFGKYFDIYAVESKRIEALSIFAPDILSLLMADYGFYDIEIVDDSLYLYDYKYLETTEELENFYEQAMNLVNEINTNSPRMLLLQAQDGAPDASAITSLKSGWSKILPYSIFVLILGGYVSAILFQKNTFIPLVIIFIAVAFSVTIGSIVFYSKRKSDYLRDRELFRKNNTQ